MRNNRLRIAGAVVGVGLGVAGVFLGIFWGNLWPRAAAPQLPPGVSLQLPADPRMQAELQKIIASAPAQAMKQPGLAAATGGVHVKVVSEGLHDILLPIPQLVDQQVPLCYFVQISPSDVVDDCQLCTRDGGNVVLSIRLKGKDQEVRISWSSVVLIAPRRTGAPTPPADPYLAASPCVQSKADEVMRLAAKLSPASGSAAEFAANIQQHIRQSVRREQPRSLDALGVLKSGENGICTANANLAAALMRARGIACRSAAVIPTTAQRMEMHRIVEFNENGSWAPFDPSSVYADVPTRPWQYITVAKTTIDDEERAMKPRMGAMVGCPYGHEAELLTPSVNLCGQDFFWSQAKALAAFEATDEAVGMAAEAWSRYLKTGGLASGQLKAAMAKTAGGFEQALRAK